MDFNYLSIQRAKPHCGLGFFSSFFFLSVFGSTSGRVRVLSSWPAGQGQSWNTRHIMPILQSTLLNKVSLSLSVPLYLSLPPSRGKGGLKLPLIKVNRAKACTARCQGFSGWLCDGKITMCMCVWAGSRGFDGGGRSRCVEQLYGTQEHKEEEEEEGLVPQFSSSSWDSSAVCPLGKDGWLGRSPSCLLHVKQGNSRSVVDFRNINHSGVSSSLRLGPKVVRAAAAADRRSKLRRWSRQGTVLQLNCNKEQLTIQSWIKVSFPALGRWTAKNIALINRWDVCSVAIEMQMVCMLVSKLRWTGIKDGQCMRQD